jgi:uncharacterized cupin superfamily protein
LVLVTDAGEQPLAAGECAGFKAGVRDGHHLQNRTQRQAVFLAIGTRNDEERGEYSDLDMTFSADGTFRHKNGEPY